MQTRTRSPANCNVHIGHSAPADSLRPGDLDLLLRHGREIRPGTFCLSRAEARAEIARLRHIIAGLERLGRDARSVRVDDLR